MQNSRNPARSRPLSANVKRLMWLSRASPKDGEVKKMPFRFSTRDLAYCVKQGNLFMEAASMGFSMSEFVPMYMTSQLAGVLDVSFSHANGMETDSLSNMLKIPLLLKSPETLVEALYWIDDIIRHTEDGQNMSLAVAEAFEEDTLRLPPALEELPDEPNQDIEELSYAYWLGYIYRCECLMHEESSRMVYGAFDETIMRAAYERLLKSPIGEMDLSVSAVDICNELDRLLVEKIWPAKKQWKKHLQALELERPEKDPELSAPAEEPTPEVSDNPS